jgi:Gas vesicle synthesis protein GvpL/GvpF
MIWVYGICERPDLPAPRRRGLAQAPLDSVREGALLAVISRHVHPPDEPALDALWVHERVVERLMEDRAVLPMRFASKAPDEATLREVLAERQDSFLAALDLVRGRVEVAVRAIRREEWSGGSDRLGAPRIATASGHDYLLSKLQDGRRTEQAAATIHEPLAALAVHSRRQRPRTAEEVLRAAYLVDRGALPRFRSAVERLQRANGGTAILCTGPWPPYSFVDGTTLPVKEAAA